MNIYEIFVEVVKAGSFSAAAKTLHRSPSSISKKISQLEEQLNIQLFDRTTRDLSVTQAGMSYYERCLDITRLINEAEEELAGLSESSSGTIRLTWPNTLSNSNIVDTLKEFSNLYPDIILDITVNNDHLNLIERNIDFAFRLSPDVNSSMIAIQISTLSPVLCASPDYVAKYGHVTNISELKDKPILLLNNPNAIQNFWKCLPGLERVSIHEHHRVNDIHALQAMTKAGFGATLLFEHMITEDLKQGRLLQLIDKAPLPKLPVYLMFHPTNFKSKKYQLFIGYFKDKYLQSTKSNLSCLSKAKD